MKLTLIRFWRNIQHERKEVLQKLCVVVRKVQTLAVFPAKREHMNNGILFTNKQRTSEMKREKEKLQSPWSQKHVS